jgi:hypothetical protein
MKSISIAPNKPVYVALVDPEGEYDSELEKSTYQTTCGQLLTLPREAIVKLNALGVKPGEQIQITRVWSGKVHERIQWTIALAHQSEMARAEAGPDNLTERLQASIDQAVERKSNTPPPTPIRKPAAPVQVEQPKLFDRRGTGTHGPAPEPMPAPAALPQVAHAVATSRKPPQQIPANIAVREILQFIEADPNTRNWADEARQGLLSTILIAAYKEKQIGIWERGE